MRPYDTLTRLSRPTLLLHPKPLPADNLRLRRTPPAPCAFSVQGSKGVFRFRTPRLHAFTASPRRLGSARRLSIANCSAAKSPPQFFWCSDDKCCPLGWVGGPLQHAAVGPRSTAPVRSTRKCPHPCRFGLTSCTATCTPPHVFPPERSVWVSRLTTRRSGCKFLNGKQDKRNRYAVTPHN